MNRRVWVLVAFAAGCGNNKVETPDAPVDHQATSDAAATGDVSDAALTDVVSDAAAPDVADAPPPEAEASDGPMIGDVADGGTDGAVSVQLPAECAGAAVPPNSLVCTGLYANITTKEIAPGVAAYAPAIPLWSDGATKQRWISLPAGMKIDNSDPNEWVFPVGTKVWKEFSKGGQRIETRLWQKVSTTYWADTAYAWNADESVATRSDGGDIPWGDGGTYHIPTPDECQQCHRGRNDRILGFEQVLLGLAGATGLTLDQLVAEDRLTVPPAPKPLVIGDDGTGLAAPALAWLHVNCGTTCHNSNSSSTAWATGLFMRLDPTMLDGRSVKTFDTLTTTIGVAAVSPAWKKKTRIVPHDPANSLLYQLISHRGTGLQMPPIATSVVDEADVPLVEAWIEEMPVPVASTDGGTEVQMEAGSENETGGSARDAGGASSDAGDALDDVPVADVPAGS